MGDFYNFQVRQPQGNTPYPQAPFLLGKGQMNTESNSTAGMLCRYMMCKPLSLGEQLKQEGFSTLQLGKKPNKNPTTVGTTTAGAGFTNG